MPAPDPRPPCFYIPLNRRRLLRGLFLASAGFMTRCAFAEALSLTPRLTEGPYYPDHLPLEQDNDLVRLSDHTSPAIGTITNIAGRILDPSGSPIKGALIELWQADDHGAYLHSRGAEHAQRDPDFQGYGKFETASDGGYRFRSIKPGLYTGRTRHYHFGVTLPGQQRRFTTQLFFAGEPGNDRDGVLKSIREPARRELIVREFNPIPGTKELATTWDIVMGLTPSDNQDNQRPPRGGQRPPPPEGSPRGNRPPPPQE